VKFISSLWRVVIFILGIEFNAQSECGERSPELSSSPDKPTPYVLVITGDEVVKGIYADTHTHFITRTLGPLGCLCLASISIGDETEPFLSVLRFAETLAPLIIVTGGLGPTDADITRQTLSQFTGIPLREDPNIIEDMKRRFGGSSGELRNNMRRQARVPEKGAYLRNPNGTAAGLIFDDGRRVVVALPGPPRELQPMVAQELIPYLSKRFGIHSIGTSLMMRFVGIGESLIDQTMHDKLSFPPDLTVAFKFELGRVDLTFSLPGNTPDDFARLKALETELMKSLGEYLYTDEGYSLEECVVRLLARRNTNLVTVEVGSGGAVAAGLNYVENAPRYFWGGHVAPSDKILARMLDFPDSSFTELESSPEALTKALARRACEQEESEWSIAVTETRKGDGDSRYLWVALGSREGGFTTQRLALRGAGESMRNTIVTQVLDLLRRKLLQSGA